MRDERVRPNEYSFDPTENRRRGADAERQTENSQNGKARSAPKHSETETKVLKKRLHLVGYSARNAITGSLKPGCLSNIRAP
jgi:hypothetical protein